MPAGSLRIAAAAALALGIAAAPALAECADDPRLATLNDVVDEIESGAAVAPVAVTPMTFLDMNPNIRRGLQDYLVILDPETCAPSQIVVGMAVTRTEVPFGLLFSRFFDAVVAGDTAGQRVILGSFTAAPLPASHVLGLGGRTGYPTPLARALAEAAGLELHTAHGANGFGDPKFTDTRDPNTGERLPWQLDISLLDFFVRFGGQTTEPGARIYLRIDYCDGYNCNFWEVAGDTHLRLAGIAQWTTALDGKRIAALLQQTGLETVDGGHLGGDGKAEYRRQYMATRTVPAASGGTEDAAPARSSLFD